MGLNALAKIRQRSAWAAATNDLHAQLERARVQAFSQAVPVAFVVHAPTARWWLVADADGNLDVAGFDPSAVAAPDRLLEKGDFAPVQVGPADGFGAALPAPYASVPAGKACSFCGANGYGALVFHGNGTAVATGTTRAAGSITLTDILGRRRTFAVLGRTASVQVFER